MAREYRVPFRGALCTDKNHSVMWEIHTRCYFVALHKSFMSSTGGLQRRRGAPAGSRLDDDEGPSRTASPQPHNGESSTTRRNGAPSNGATAASSAELRGGAGSITMTTTDGHRIAFDPRDLQDEGETAENPRLTLMEECLLLGLKDRQVSLFAGSKPSLIFPIRVTCLSGTITYLIPCEAVF